MRSDRRGRPHTSAKGKARSPARELADRLLESTLGRSLPGDLDGRCELFLVHGVRSSDAQALALAARQDDEEDLRSIFEGGVRTYDWTDPSVLRAGRVDQLLLDLASREGSTLVLFRRRSDIPGVLVAIATEVRALADRRGIILGIVERTCGFVPSPDIVDRLRRLPLDLCNIAILEGSSAERLRSVAGRLGRHAKAAETGPVLPRHEPKVEGRPKRRGTKLPSNEIPTERLQNLPETGEAHDWGLGLAKDIALYRSRRLKWSDVDGGVVLHGPPGTGKTLFARALAGTCGVPLHAHSFAAWQARGHLGDLLRAMRNAFEAAREAAPCILFIDELDSIGSRDEPAGDHTSYQRQVVNGFLECLDGTIGRDGVVVVAATNFLAAIDTAVLRPGRLGRHIEMPLPGVGARSAILRYHLGADLPEADLLAIADELDGSSAATLAQVVREARLIARRQRRSICEMDLVSALPSGALMSEEAFNRACVHEAGHVVAGLRLSHESGLIPTGAIVRRRSRTDADHRTDFEAMEGFDVTGASVDAQVVVLLSGIAAEEMILGKRGAGSGGSSESDLVRATQLILASERSFGLGSGLASMPITELDGRSPWAFDHQLRDRIETRLTALLVRARSMVELHRRDVEAVADALHSGVRIDLSKKIDGIRRIPATESENRTLISGTALAGPPPGAIPASE